MSDNATVAVVSGAIYEPVEAVIQAGGKGTVVRVDRAEDPCKARFGQVEPKQGERDIAINATALFADMGSFKRVRGANDVANRRPLA